MNFINEYVTEVIILVVIGIVFKFSNSIVARKQELTKKDLTEKEHFYEIIKITSKE